MDLIRRQKFRHLPMRRLERLDSAIQIKTRLADRREESCCQRQVQLDAGVSIAALAAIERQMQRQHPGLGGTAATERREFVISHPDLRHIPVRLLL
ncbi:hypothetical protein FXB38_34600 [Bradyrhizobium cytisi]|uniref:Uncharacterized protein n=1 Tax=Bradyrhizobium cytisi TaxID=515489 RepID=A0A5S4WGR1_9BRAD|nr:hypothetical protein FXB38_34600 [Bradyrhizobium cytisi]